MIKKILMTLAASLLLAAAGLGGFAWHIYKKDFGVDYKGCARLHYNWKYYFAELPKEDYVFKGRLFSYKYPKFRMDSEMVPVEDENGGLIEDSGHVLMVRWSRKDPDFIKTELVGQLEDKEPKPFSRKFLGWLSPEDSYVESASSQNDYSKSYDVKSEKIKLKHGGTALLISLQSKVQDRPHVRFLAGVTPAGQVFRAKIRVRFNVSEGGYRDLVLRPTGTYGSTINPERDAQSAYFLKKFIETLSFEK